VCGVCGRRVLCPCFFSLLVLPILFLRKRYPRAWKRVGRMFWCMFPFFLFPLSGRESKIKNFKKRVCRYVLSHLALCPLLLCLSLYLFSQSVIYYTYTHLYILNSLATLKKVPRTLTWRYYPPSSAHTRVRVDEKGEGTCVGL
jgi:hypothetical protein